MIYSRTKAESEKSGVYEHIMAISINRAMRANTDYQRIRTIRNSEYERYTSNDRHSLVIPIITIITRIDHIKKDGLANSVFYFYI